MSRHRHDPVVRALRDLGQTSVDGAHLDAVDLAAWVDHALDEDAAARAERHLAECAECRALAGDVEDAVRETTETRTRPTARPVARRAPWLAAAAAILVLGVWTFGRGGDPTPIADRAWASLVDDPARVPTNLARWLDDAFDHQAPSPPWQLPLGSWHGDDATRTANSDSDIDDRPIALAPRWTAVREPRPAFSWAAGRAVLERGARHRVLLVDDQERTVFEGPIAPSSAEQPDGTAPVVLRADYPEAAPDLSPGSTYAWSVSTETGGRRYDAAFVPFRVLKIPEDATLVDPGDDPGLVAVALAARGLDDEALAALADLPPSTARETLAEVVMARKRLPSHWARHITSRPAAP